MTIQDTDFYFNTKKNTPSDFCSHLPKICLNDAAGGFTGNQTDVIMPGDAQQTQQQGPQGGQQQETPAVEIPGAEAFVVLSSSTEPAQQPEGQQQAAENPIDGEKGSQQTTETENEEHGEAGKKSRWTRMKESRDNARREAEAAKRELAELKGQQQSAQTLTTDEPNIEDYATWDAYEAAHEAWKANQGQQNRKPDEKPEEQPAQQPNISSELKYAIEDMQSSFDESRKKYQDFDQLISAKDLKMPEAVVIMVSETENPGEVAYYLATHKDEAAKIAAMSAIRQAKALAEVEKKVLQQGPPPKRKSSAPPPIEPLDGSGDTHKKTVNEMSFQELEFELGQKKPGALWS